MLVTQQANNQSLFRGNNMNGANRGPIRVSTGREGTPLREEMKDQIMSSE